MKNERKKTVIWKLVQTFKNGELHKCHSQFLQAKQAQKTKRKNERKKQQKGAAYNWGGGGGDR